MSSTLLMFGSNCFGVTTTAAASRAANDDDDNDNDDTDNGWCMCPSTVSYLLPAANNNSTSTILNSPHDDDDDDDDDVMQPLQQPQENNNTKMTSPSSFVSSSSLRVAAHRRRSSSSKGTTTEAAGGQGVVVVQQQQQQRQQSCTVSARLLRHRQEEEAEALKQNMIQRRPMSLLQGTSTLSKHTASSPEKTEPSTDEENEGEEEDGRGGVQALVNFCVRECDEDCVAEPQLMVEEEEDRTYMLEAVPFGLQKNSSGIVANIELLSAEQAQQQGQEQPGRGRRVLSNTPTAASAAAMHHPLAHLSPCRLLWNNSNNKEQTQQQPLQHQEHHHHVHHHDNVNFVPTDADYSSDALSGRMVCIYRPRRSWPDGEVRIRWALSRNTSPTTAVVLERWTAAVELSPSSATCNTTTTPLCFSSTDIQKQQQQDHDEFPTRLLNLSETNDATTARLDGMVEIHDETTTTTARSPQENVKQAGAETITGANHHSDNGTSNDSREIAWLTCYRIIFDEHADNIENNNSKTEKKDDEHHVDMVTDSLSVSSLSPTLIPDPNGTSGYSEKKLAARRLFAQFDEARHGPLRQMLLQRNQEKEEAYEQQQQAAQDEQQLLHREDSRPGSPATSRSVLPTPSSAARGSDDDVVINKESSLLPRLELQQQQRESLSSSSSSSSKKSGNSRSKKKTHQYFVIQDLAVHDEYRGLGLGLCLLDDACRRICDPEAWVLVALPPQPQPCPSLLETEGSSSSSSSSSSNHNNQPKSSRHRNKRRLSLGRASLSSMTSSLFSTRDKKSSTTDVTESKTLTEHPQQTKKPGNNDDDTLLSYLGLLGFERLTDDSPFCVRWNQSNHLPTIEEVCPHVPIFHAPPPPAPPSPPLHQHHHDGSGGNGIGNGCDGADTQHPPSS